MNERTSEAGSAEQENERTSKWTSEWPSNYVVLLGSSGRKWTNKAKSFLLSLPVAFAEYFEFDKVADFSFAIDHGAKSHFLHVTNRETNAKRAQTGT